MNCSSLINLNDSILQEIQLFDWKKRGIRVLVKRDDLLDEQISGNKWRKLKYNIEQAFHLKSEGIFTFGGAYSNHLLATAKACHAVGFKSKGFVRGEELTASSNHTLSACSAYGMELEFLSREMYALHSDKMFVDELKLENPSYYAIPEGGSNFYGMIGCQEIWKELPETIDAIFVAQGTTTTSCGLLLGAPAHTKVHVVPVLKGFESIETMRNQLNYTLFDTELVEDFLAKVTVHNDAHFGGYGKYSLELIEFIQKIYRLSAIPLDPIYTAKAFYALVDYLKNPAIKDETVLFYHSGGIQGNASIEQKEKIQFFQ